MSGRNSTELRKRAVEKLERELGPEICALIDQPDVVEIMLNPDGTLWVERTAALMQPFGSMSRLSAQAMMSTIASLMDIEINPTNPILECELPFKNARFEGWFPPVVSSPTFTIRCKPSVIFTLDDYVASHIMTPAQKHQIDDAIDARKNILVVGGTGTGKTTLANAIIDRVVDMDPEHRLFIIEDTSEIQCRAENHVTLRATRHVDMLHLLKSTMRGRPDRIIVGEVRAGAEALTLLKSWNTGHPGGVTTIHANTAASGLTRLEQLIAEVSKSPMQHLIGEAVGLIVSIVKDGKHAAGRRVEEIVSVSGFSSGNYEFERVEE